MNGNMKFKKVESVFVNTDSKGYHNHKTLKKRLIDQQKTISELNERLSKVEKLILNMN